MQTQKGERGLDEIVRQWYLLVYKVCQGRGLVPAKTVQRSLRMPEELVAQIQEDADKNERSFTQQVVYMLRVGKSVDAALRSGKRKGAA
jgi:hypothetical protein